MIKLSPESRDMLMIRFSLATIAVLHATTAVAQDRIDFTRDIRPIFSNYCFQCHGPDANQREADLRLDIAESIFSHRDEIPLLVAGEPEQSELYLRISTTDPQQHMPPPDHERQPTAEQIQLIKEWIAQGAEMESHWAFQPPRRPPPPDVQNTNWPQNEIDRFVLNRLESHDLSPSPQADRRTLIRRATLDLTGLPPTPDEVHDFLVDDSPQAFERVVDRLLKSPRYGEHMAGDWLDAARYADTSGYQNDGPRDMWRWRDWVIEAFNDNLPFDQFTTEQLAGDLLEFPTLPQRIATGFNRNHRGNAEGGIIPAEFQVEYVVDRVETTSTIWLGLTLGCARCHDHKYDPFSQKEFYQLYALFNNIPEHGRAIKEGNSPPCVVAPTRSQQAQLEKLRQRAKELTQRVQQSESGLNAALKKWEDAHHLPPVTDWHPTDGLIAEFDFNDDQLKFIDGEPVFADRDGTRAIMFDGRRYVDAGAIANFGYFDSFSFACWIQPDQQSQQGTIVSRMEDVPQGTGYSVRLNDRRVEIDLVKRWLDDSIRVQTEMAIVPADEWTHLVVTYDGSRLASGIQVFINGDLQPLNIQLDYINQSFAAEDAPLRIGAGHGSEGRFSGMISQLRIYDRVLEDREAQVLSEPSSILSILQTPPHQWTDSQSAKLIRWFIETQAPQELRDLSTAERQARRELASFQKSLPTVMVMEEMPSPRPTFVLTRGEYDKPADQVSPGVPSVLNSERSVINNRLDFAHWLVDPANPLTARVAVNRVWQQLFGVGLVKSPEDFGSQGELPSHPELLDWLATEFVQLNWDVKALQKLIVMSATYQQASRISQELLQRDPQNQLLARGPRVRLSARMLRDQALFVSGLLHEEIGGPSVKPYQPEGLWREIATTTEYEQSTGHDLYRRSLYTYWKRTVAPPNLAIFDAAGRETCVVRSTRTNTPLQALAVMNDVTFLEAARALAERSIHESDDRVERIKHCFVLATARYPDSAELNILLQSFESHSNAYQENQDAARQLISHGASQPDESITPPELAAMTMIATTILNFDEVINKE